MPETVFEELLVNALMHRDYLISAPIRLFIFDNRIEIVSPGHLPNNLTVEKIRAGNSNIRNPILVSYVAKGLLPYHFPTPRKRSSPLTKGATAMTRITQNDPQIRLVEKRACAPDLKKVAQSRNTGASATFEPRKRSEKRGI